MISIGFDSTIAELDSNEVNSGLFLGPSAVVVVQWTHDRCEVIAVMNNFVEKK